MADLNSEFIKYNEEISLPKSKKDKLISGRDAIRKAIETYFSDTLEEKIPAFFQQGSFALKTVVNPISGEYDVDDGLYLQHLDENNLPKTESVHNWIMKALKDHTKDGPSDKKSCVRVVYSGDYHVDIPIYTKQENENLLARKGDDQWINSDSKGFNEWFYNKLDLHGEQIRRIIKYLKAYKDYKGMDIPGIVFTVLGINNFTYHKDRDDTCLVKVAESCLSYLSNNTNLYMPVEPYDNILEKYSKSKIDELKNLFEELSESGGKAIDVEDYDESVEYWGILLGDRFLKGIKTSNSKEAIVATPIVISRDTVSRPYCNDELVPK